LPVYKIDIYPFLNTAISISPFIVAYAIFRYRLMDIRLVARQVYLYFGSAIFAYLIFYLVSIFEEKLFGSIYSENALLFGALIAISFAFVYGLVLKLLNRLADKHLFSGLYNYQAAINRLSSQLTYHTDLTEITELITQTIREVMGVNKVEILIDVKNTRDPLIKYLKQTERPIVLDELQALLNDERLKTQSGDFQILINQMEKIGASVCLPLISNKRLIGEIILGPKPLNDPFTTEDLELLTTLSNQAGIAIDNAQLYKEVKDFNKTLKQKVNEQTMSLQDKTKVLEEQAEHLKKLLAMRSEFLDIASHQLKTPISVISGTISMFKEGSVQKMPKETEDKLIDNIYQKSLKISQIIRDILQASEFDTEKFSFVEKRIVPVDLNKMLTEVVKDSQSLADEKKLQLIFTPNPANPQIKSDPDYLEQAFSNLVDNALKYTKEGKVEVILDENPQSVIIKVRDTGVGIPKDDQTRMFGKFERAKNAVDMYTDGSGLGLFITKEIIEAHPGGTITFTSEEGKGTEFTITIPKTK
jgi:signal transduction histidine kinase